MKKPAIIIVVILVLAAVASGVLLTRKAEAPVSNSEAKPAQETAESRAEIQESLDTSSATAAATITYNDGGFSPNSVTVKAGEVIEVKNTSSRGVQFDSDPHPVHSDNKELNIDIISPGTSKKFKVSTKGTWGFHNHLDPTQSGSITVE